MRRKRRVRRWTAKDARRMRRRRENIRNFYHTKEMNRLREKIRLLGRIKELRG